MIRRKLDRRLLVERPRLEWNAFVHLLAMTRYEELDEVQRVAHLCFWYDAEVQNGGHLQYFENRGTTLVGATLGALTNLGAEGQRDILEGAVGVLGLKPRERLETVEDYVAAARTGEFAEFDAACHTCRPEIQ